MANSGSTGRGLLTAKYILRDEATSSWRGDRARPSLRKRERSTQRLGVPGGQPDRHKQERIGPFSLESSGSTGCNAGLKSGKLGNFGLREVAYLLGRSVLAWNRSIDSGRMWAW